MATGVIAGTVPGGGRSLLKNRGPDQPVPRRKAVEVPVAADGRDEAVLGRPLALAADADRLYVADALDCAIKVFTKDGRFLRSFGRKGAGPGELSFPSGVAVSGDEVVVADKLNLRIQTYGREGAARGGFKVPFAPDRVFSLGGGRILVTGNPTGRRPEETILHIYDAAGQPAWRGLEARASKERVFDAFRNMVLVCPGDEGGFFVIYKSGGREILEYASSGVLRKAIGVDERYAYPTVSIPAGGGAMKLDGFCWAASRDRGLFYLAAAESVDGKDLGPGRWVSVLDGQGRLRAVVELPCAVHRFLVSDGRMFAIDDEGALRIFEVGP